jgi:chromosomal replication initiator protein
MKHLEFWPLILERLKKRINPQSFDAWISPLRPLSSEGKSIKLEVPDVFFRDWLLEHYLRDITEAASEALGYRPDVAFLISDNDEIPRPEKEQAPEGQNIPRSDKDKKALECGLNPKYTFDSFVVGSCNRFAHAAGLAICESPAKSYNPLFIYGGVGLGKTHLMQSMGNRIVRNFPKAKVMYISSEKFTNQLISAIQNRSTHRFRQMYRSADILLIDDIHFIAGKESTQEGFFHTFNALYEANKQIVVSSDRPPKDIPGLEERLVSRFGWGLVVDMQPPDLEMRVAILKSKAERERVDVPNDAVFFIAENVKSNIRELEGALIRVVAYSKLMNQQITRDLVSSVLKGMFVEESKKITIDIIQKKVVDYFDIRIADIRGKKRSKDIAFPRQIAMYLTRDLMKCSLGEIGEYFGGRDHTTVLHSCEKVASLLKKDDKTRLLLKNLVDSIKN